MAARKQTRPADRYSPRPRVGTLNERVFAQIVEFAMNAERCPDNAQLTLAMLKDKFELNDAAAHEARERLIREGYFFREAGVVLRVCRSEKRA